MFPEDAFSITYYTQKKKKLKKKNNFEHANAKRRKL